MIHVTVKIFEPGDKKKNITKTFHIVKNLKIFSNASSQYTTEKIVNLQ